MKSEMYKGYEIEFTLEEESWGIKRVGAHWYKQHSTKIYPRHAYGKTKEIAFEKAKISINQESCVHDYQIKSGGMTDIMGRVYFEHLICSKCGNKTTEYGYNR